MEDGAWRLGCGASLQVKAEEARKAERWDVAAESSLSAPHSLHVVLIQSTVRPQQSRNREVAFQANPHFGFPETVCEVGCRPD